MVVIFGWGEGNVRDMGEVAPVTCPNCHNDVFLHDVRSDKRVSLYFVPLVPYGSNEYLACPICRHGMEIRPEHRGAVDQMRAATAVYRRGGVAQDRYLATVQGFWARVGGPPSAPPGQGAGPPSAVRPPASDDPRWAGPASAARPAAGGSPSLAEELDGLAKLHADGVLTDDEFAAAKKRLLEG